MCSAEELPKNLFTAGHLSLRDEDNNMKLMDDLGIQAVGYTWPCGFKTFVILSSAETIIYPAYEC